MNFLVHIRGSLKYDFAAGMTDSAAETEICVSWIKSGIKLAGICGISTSN